MKNDALAALSAAATARGRAFGRGFAALSRWANVHTPLGAVFLYASQLASFAGAVCPLFCVRFLLGASGPGKRAAADLNSVCHD